MKYTSIFALTLFAAAAAVAQPYNISWVASTGANTAACGTRAAPCLNFQTAHDHTNPGGIIKAVDADNFGTVTVSKAITIDGNGVGAEIELGGTGTAILITSGPVTIRDLTIHVVLNGIGIFAGANTHIENVVIAGEPQNGVFVQGNTLLTAKNLTVVGATSVGIYLNGSAEGSVSASIRDSVIRSYFGGQGILVRSNAASAVALIERCEMSSNSTGLVADNLGGFGATVRISDSVITGNNTGISAINGGQIISFRTNMLAGNNVTDGATPFSISLK